jgi:putative glutamine amidotransferase
MRELPIIGLSTSVTVGKHPERSFVNAAYVDAVLAAGGVPLLLPPQLRGEARSALRQRLAGLILTGGGDVDPARSGAPRHATVVEVSPARDDLEIDLTRWALDGGVPLLAICRGLQVLNVALGGTLYQDIPSDPGSPLAHSQAEPRPQATHSVKVTEGSRLATILGRLDLDVNSFHHQAIKNPGSGLRVVAAAPDGIIEGAEVSDHPFAVGVQWHPEEMTEHDVSARGLFVALIDAARRVQATPVTKRRA